MKTRLIFFYLPLIPVIVSAQSVRLTKTEQQGDNIIIWYDLSGSIEGQLFNVEIYGSHNNYKKPLSFASGDLGANIKPGIDKKITWNVKADLVKFTGTIEFQIKATIQYSPLNNLSVTGPRRLKRGNIYQVTWEGGEPDDLLNLELYRKGDRIYTIPKIENSGTFDWTIPKNIKPGNQFTFRLREVKDLNQGTISKIFKIKRKTPRALFVVPAIVITGVITYIIIKQTEEEQLPRPPGNPDTWQ